ncbi:PepSY domain-containing protein [Brevundimonas sp.]|uniref:PepSY domain-containing protein n=1 Tax=unclassified Brevundimonas TaxID=2622653 RepID=UPI003AFF73A9
MKRKIVIGLSAAALVTTLAVGGVALAGATQTSEDQDEGREIAAALAARVSLADAVSIAERQGGGKALEAAFDDETGNRWEIELAQNGRVVGYTVDMSSGAVSPAAAEAEDGEGPEDED